MDKGAEHKVDVLPIGHALVVPADQAIMLVALANGWRWPNVCGGQAACGVCVLEILEGSEHASPIGRDEAVRLAAIRKADKTGARLACQLRAAGPMRVFKRGARPLLVQDEPLRNEEGP